MMGLYPTLGLVAALAALALIALWLYFGRSPKPTGFPAEAWDSYLDEGKEISPATEDGFEEVEKISGPEEEEDFTPPPPVPDTSLASRLKGLESVPLSHEEGKMIEEGGREESGAGEGSPARQPREMEGQIDRLAGSPPSPLGQEESPGGEAPDGGVQEAAPAPADSLGGEGAAPAEGGRPWWEDLPTPKEVPFRRTVAQLMGVAPAEAPPLAEPSAPEAKPLPSGADAEGAAPPPAAPSEEAGEGGGMALGDASLGEGEKESGLLAGAASLPEVVPGSGAPTEGPAAVEEAGEPEVQFEEEPAAFAEAPEDALRAFEEPEAVLEVEEVEEGSGAEDEEEEAEPAPAAPSSEETAGTGAEPVGAGEAEPPVFLKEEGEKEDVFSVLARERGDSREEDLPEEPVGGAPLFEAVERLEAPSEREEEAFARPEAPPPPESAVVPEADEEAGGLPSEREEVAEAPSEVPPPDSPSEKEESALGSAPAAEQEAVAPPAEPPPEEGPVEEVVPPLSGLPAEVVRNLVSEHCPGDLLLIEESDVRLPAQAAGVAEAAGSDLRERRADRGPTDAEEFLRLGIVEHFIGRHAQAAAHLKEALRRTDRLGPVLNALAVTTYARGRVDPAISYCKEAIREAGDDAALRVAVYRNLGLLYQVKGEVARAAEAIVSAIESLGPLEDARLLSRLHLRAGQLLRRLGEAGKARGHLSESALLFKGAGDEPARARALVALAAAQTELREFEAALKDLGEASRLCRALGDKAGEALVFGQMGLTYAAQDQFTRALGHYEGALALHRELGNRKGEAANLSNVGNIHYFRGDIEEAQAAYEAALEINREQGHPIGQATSLGNLGRLHLERGDLSLARERLAEARDIFRQAGAQEQLENVCRMLEELDRAQGE